MKISLSFAHLHTPLFFARINWGEKLDVKNTAKGKLKLTYDRVEKELIVECDGRMTIIPTSNVVSMDPIPESLEAQVTHDMLTPVSPFVPPKGKRTAQASSPMDHVHQGPGNGKVRD